MKKKLLILVFQNFLHIIMIYLHALEFTPPIKSLDRWIFILKHQVWTIEEYEYFDLDQSFLERWLITKNSFLFFSITFVSICSKVLTK